MKKISLLITFASIVYHIQAQTTQPQLALNKPFSILQSPYKPLSAGNFGVLNNHWLYNPTCQFGAIDISETQQNNIDNMPVVNYKPELIYLDNNQRGFDIYHATPDNMYVLKPDYTFLSNMPTGNDKSSLRPSPNK